MLYVSHYIGEITEICDAVTVFRNGADVGVIRPVSARDADGIIRLMVGRELGGMFPPRTRRQGEPMLACDRLGDGARFAEVSFTVGAGEIVGIAGLVGSGREEVVDALYGLRRLTAGAVTLDGKPIRIDTPATALAHGFALVPRDRRHAGLVLDMTVADNVNLASLDTVAVAGLERRGMALRRAADLVARLDIRPPDPAKVARYLSGGNQQKVVLARWLATGARLFILDEPTIGVDIGAKVELYRLVGELAARGAAIIVSSSDDAELLGLCDRVVVMLRGRVVATRDGGRARPRRPPGADLGQCRRRAARRMIALAATPASRLGHLRHLLVARGPLLLFALLLVVLRAARTRTFSTGRISRRSSSRACRWPSSAAASPRWSWPAATTWSKAASTCRYRPTPCWSRPSSPSCWRMAASALPIAFAAGALAGLAIGAANALLVVAIGMTPLLATLASSVAVVGLAKVVTSNRRINVDGPVVTILRDGTVLGVPVAVLLMAAVGAGFVYALHWTRWGLQLQAVGGNRDAADISGLPSDRRTAQAFVVAALAAVIAAPTILARGSGSSPGSEETLLVEMVLATFLGAAFSPRRVVTIWGALLGALLVNALSNGLALMRVDIFWIGGIKGALILIVVATAAIRTGNQR